MFIRILSQFPLMRKLIIPTLSTALLWLILQFGFNWWATSHAQTTNQSYQPLTSPPNSAEQVQAGMYPVNIYNVDAASSTYYVDFYAWFKWKGEIDPTTNLEFTNGVEDWGLTQVAGYENPEKLPDGSTYQVFRVESRFVQPFVLTRYPLDQQKLSIRMENSVYASDKLVYLADQKDSGIARDLALPGWRIKGFSLSNLLHEYNSSFGDPRPSANSYSALEYEINISRPLSFFIWKLLLPLVIVLVSSWGAHLLTPSYVDARILMPVTALLTTVFLQQSYSSALPDVGYLVLLDKIYALAYLLVIVAILETIVTADWVSSGKPEDAVRVVKLDRWLLVGQAITLVLGTLIIIATT
jgi:hypothetical protein